ncbi:HAMP domain-containing sensor histidine kinase [Psychromonas sp. Urea-02u-13]|uniref:HAMP domain-containing sensor histidine kinase n=1 Tax=Psychromonas sp. Urea-02u-13 TaxID=2058326 RepID=UPI000C331F6D|nr:ATP-binding protein [Psychromonas sp. Urea-02u-13]PKG38802.1 sensor histidine kinase [Psychromonas sp. Urea-02u-13]
MLFDSRKELSSSSILKWLVSFAIVLFLMMSLLMYQLYHRSVELYNANLDQWLIGESEQLAQISEVDGQLALQENIQELRKDKRYIYHFTGEKRRKIEPSNNYPTIAQIDTQAEPLQTVQDYPTMRATKVILADGRELVVGINREQYQQFKKDLDISIVWSTFYPFLALFVMATWIAMHLLNRLNLVNQTMNRVMDGERGVRLSVSKKGDEFDALATHLNNMLDQLEKSESKLKSLTVDIAHDLRTPMGRIKLRIEDLLNSGQFLPKNELLLSEIQQDFSLLIDTFSGMMELYNLETGRVPVAKKSCDLNKIVNDVLDFTEPLALDKNQEIYITVDMPCILQGNPSLLFRAVFNLLDNAIKYTPENGVIEIIIDCFGVVIADNGKGIKAEDRERALDQLVRLDPSRSVHGFGLGLALVNTVMKIHDGQIGLSNNYPGLRARLFFNELAG